MTLKDKFLKASVIEGVVDNSEIIAATNVMIAEEFAIGFTEWVVINYPNQRKLLLKQGNLDGFYSTKELLEIYKREKNL